MSKEFKISDVKILIDNEVYVSIRYICKSTGCSMTTLRKYVTGQRRYKLKTVKVNGFYFVKEDDYKKFQEFREKLGKLSKDTKEEIELLEKEYEQEAA